MQNQGPGANLPNGAAGGREWEAVVTQLKQTIEDAKTAYAGGFGMVILAVRVTRGKLHSSAVTHAPTTALL